MGNRRQKTLKRINKLIEDICRNSIEGSGNLHIALAIAGLALTIGFVGFALRRNKARQ